MFSVQQMKAFLKAGYYSIRHQGFSFWGWRPEKNVLLITGVPGYGGGPFTFLKFLLERLQVGHTVVCSFQKSQVQEELVRYCENRGILLLVRPDGGPWRDLAQWGSPSVGSGRKRS